MELFSTFAISVLAVGAIALLVLIVYLAYTFGMARGAVLVLRNPPKKRIEVQSFKFGRIDLRWPKPFVYEPPQAEDLEEDEPEEIKLPGGVTGKKSGRPRDEVWPSRTAMEYGFKSADEFFRFLKDLKESMKLGNSLRSLCNQRTRQIPESTARHWLERWGKMRE